MASIHIARLAIGGASCPDCGAARSEDEGRCTCGALRPPGGWDAQGLTGVELPRPAGMRIGRMRKVIGPLARYALTGAEPTDHVDGSVWVLRDQRRSDEARARSEAFEKLDHPLVGGMGALGALDGFTYRVETELPGLLAYDCVVTGGSLLFDEAISLVADLADALALLHAAGIVHGHLNLESFSIVDETRSVRPVLGPPPLVMPGDWMPHVAPEVRRGSEPDVRSDIFGLGYVLASLVLGSPVDGGGQDTGWTAEDDGPAMDLPFISDDEVDLRRFIESLVDRDPDERPSDPSEVAQTLREFLPAPTDELAASSHPKGPPPVMHMPPLATLPEMPAIRATPSSLPVVEQPTLPRAPRRAPVEVEPPRSTLYWVVVVVLMVAFGVLAGVAGWWIAANTTWLQALVDVSGP